MGDCDDFGRCVRDTPAPFCTLGCRRLLVRCRTLELHGAATMTLIGRSCGNWTVCVCDVDVLIDVECVAFSTSIVMECVRS